jgi:hypothetical protein
MHPVAIWLVLLMSAWISIEALGCNQQSASPTEGKHPQGSETVVGEMSRTALDKAKAVEGTLQQSADRTADTLNVPAQ